jgi:ankyrin repeat protein
MASIHELLFQSSGNGDLTAVLNYLQAGADPEMVVANGETSLGVASYFGREDVIVAFIQHGVNPRARDGKNKTALICASRRGHVSVVRLLIEHFTDSSLDCQDNSNWTALMYASFNGHAEIVQLLLEAGANVNIVASGSNETALVLSVDCLLLDFQSSFSITKQLLRAGADASIRNYEGKTFIDLAPEKYRVKLQELLDYELSNMYQIGQLK